MVAKYVEWFKINKWGASFCTGSCQEVILCAVHYQVLIKNLDFLMIFHITSNI